MSVSKYNYKAKTKNGKLETDKRECFDQKSVSVVKNKDIVNKTNHIILDEKQIITDEDTLKDKLGLDCGIRMTLRTFFILQHVSTFYL